MSFGPSDVTRQGMSQLGTNAAQTSASGGNLLNLGNTNTGLGTNFFRTILGGNQANTTAMLQPDIDRLRAGTQNTLQAVSTLMPRGGGRSGTLFNLPFAANTGVQNLFNTARTGAAGVLPQIGAGQTSAGANLFGIGNQAATSEADLGQRQQQISSMLQSALGSGLFNLATLPLGGFGGTALGKLGGLFRTPSFVPSDFG